MSGLPTITCPGCNAVMSLDVALGHAGARDALLSLATLHPSGTRLQLLALRYAGLFAPRKQNMRFDRLAAVLAELKALVESGRGEWQGIAHPAPLDYWMNAMEAMLARRDAGALETPLANHNYLRAIVAGYSEKQQAADERKQEDARAGRTPVGRPPAPPPFKQAPPKQPRAERTTQDFETLYAAIGRGMQQEKPE